MDFLFLNGLLHFSFVDVIDILLVALLIYGIFKLVKNTNAIRIFLGIFVIYIIWQVVELFQLRLLSDILGKFISIGVLALVVVFQPEIRRFLLLLGSRPFKDTSKITLFKHFSSRKHNMLQLDPVIQACSRMSQTKTGALIVFGRGGDLSEIIDTGEKVNSALSSALLETIFFKNTPLHDGAVVVDGNKIVAARCILPVSSNPDIDPNLGLRHRSALGLTELTDAVAIVVSEQTGSISLVESGNIQYNISTADLRENLGKLLSNLQA
ncbi:MAG: diadenylate cyclase CdaA [Bacteroidales bacterium]|nr:diadenylate cyclase CdaA [Bacteroidales bacterium]